MKVLLCLLVFVSGCTTFKLNGPEVRRSCKSGVREYDDGSVSFKCFEINPSKSRINAE